MSTREYEEFELTFTSTLHYLDLVQEISEKITRIMGFSEDERYWIGLSLRESVTNAILHGNKGDESKKVAVRFSLQPDRLVIRVSDEGEGFDESKVPDPLAPENLLKPSGRGIFYMRQFMDNVEYELIPSGGLEVKMQKMVNQEERRRVK
ncbi:MAG: ATP-binding protein [Acidobacteria bacterium]|nr:ATP-binding protein [Acidobacteriota bacterium]